MRYGSDSQAPLRGDQACAMHCLTGGGAITRQLKSDGRSNAQLRAQKTHLQPATNGPNNLFTLGYQCLDRAPKRFRRYDHRFQSKREKHFPFQNTYLKFLPWYIGRELECLHV